MKQDDIVTFYGKVRMASIKPNDTEPGGASHYQIQTRYINNTRKVIRAKLRSNIELTIPAVAPRTTYAHEELFIVRQDLVVSGLCAEQMREYFINLPEVSGELELFRKTYLQVYDNVYNKFGHTRELRCSIEHTFTEQELRQFGGMFYHDELDTLFKFGDEPFGVAHPHSREGREDKIVEDATALRDQHGFVFWVEIIDNAGKYGERFVSICNQIYKIVPSADKTKQDGLYIVSSAPTNGKINSTEITRRSYSMENIDKELGIWPTYELAVTHGDIAGARKRETMEREAEISKLKRDWDVEKIQMQREAADRERQIKEMEMERVRNASMMEDLRQQQQHLMKMQDMHTRDRLDQKQAERKDASELIKFLPTILSGIGMLIMAYKAFKTS